MHRYLVFFSNNTYMIVENILSILLFLPFVNNPASKIAPASLHTMPLFDMFIVYTVSL